MKKEEILIQTRDVQVRIIELKAAEMTPYHHHTEITDNMFGISGEISVQMKDPDEEVLLTPGSRCTVATGRIHRVVNDLQTKTSSYLLIQGVGSYDFIEDDA